MSCPVLIQKRVSTGQPARQSIGVRRWSSGGRSSMAQVLDTVWMITVPGENGQLDGGIVYSGPARSATDAWEKAMVHWHGNEWLEFRKREDVHRQHVLQGWRARRVTVC